MKKNILLDFFSSSAFGTRRFKFAGIPNDVANLDDRYHKDCTRGFFLSFNKDQKSQSEKDYSFVNLVAVIRSDRTQIWNAVELYNLYNLKNEASYSSQKDSWTLIKHLLDFNGALVSFLCLRVR